MKTSNYEWTDHWQRKFFALFVALCIWLGTRETLQTTRTFTHVPVRIINISPDWTIGDLGPEGLLPDTITLVLKGKKLGLNQMLESRVEVVVDAQGRTRPWMEKISAKQLRSDAKIDVARTVKKVSLGEILIPLTPAICEEIPLHLHTSGSLSDHHYQLIDFTPRQEYQVMFGPEEMIQELKKRGLHGEINLSLVDCEQLKWQWDRSEHNRRFEELSYPYIDSINCTSYLPHVNSSALTSKKLEQAPRLFVLPDLPQTLAGDFPVQMQWDGSDAIDTKRIEEQFGGHLYQIGGKWRYRGELEIRHVSGELIKLIDEQSSLQLACNLCDELAPTLWSWHLLKAESLTDRYVARMREQTSDSAHLPEKFLRKRFRHYTRQMRVIAKSPARFDIKRSESRFP